MDTNIQKYKAFITTVETGSFSRAAGILNYSQSGISRMIKDIEEEWNVTLLERNRNGVRLTPDGEKLLPNAKSLIREYEALEHAIDGLSGLDKGLIKIGAYRGMQRDYISNAVSRFLKEYPGIDFEIAFYEHGEIENLVRLGQIDIGFMRLPVGGGMESEFVLQERLVALYKSDIKTDETFRVSRFQDEPFILYEGNSSGDISALLKRCNVTPRISVRTADASSVISLVKSGAGMAIIPEGIFKELAGEKTTRGKVKTAPLDIPAYIDIGAVYKDKKEISVAVKTFLKFL